MNSTIVTALRKTEKENENRNFQLYLLYAAPLRSALTSNKHHTISNILGPLLYPLRENRNFTGNTNTVIINIFIQLIFWNVHRAAITNETLQMTHRAKLFWRNASHTSSHFFSYDNYHVPDRKISSTSIVFIFSSHSSGAFF